MKSNRSNFQPKDARTVSIPYEEEEDDDDDMTELYPHHGKRMLTTTQALVEFLKTTSPEEFQRTTPEKSANNLFSRIRKTKRNGSNTNSHSSIIPTSSISTRSVPSSTTTLPVTLGSTLSSHTSYQGSEFIARKNYIEIVPPKLISRSAGNSRSPSFDTASIQSFVLRNNSKNNNNNNNNQGGEPILPNKKRESSIYSGSLRHSASIRSQLSTATNTHSGSVGRRTLTRDGTLRKADTKATEEFLSQRDGMDAIESALMQRLERMRIAHEKNPSDKIAAGLTMEHIRALGITHTLDNQNLQDIDKTKVRHMQVQTEDNLYSHDKSLSSSSSSEEIRTPPHTPKLTDSNSQDRDIRAKRAEAALENALDHFEVISGLAYKKLRELWEEKIKWENACIELRDRLLTLEQKRYPSHQFNGNDHGLGNLRGEYFPEENEEEDELGLSEFPCSEN